jgi:hypothetical protein
MMAAHRFRRNFIPYNQETPDKQAGAQADS